MRHDAAAAAKRTRKHGRRHTTRGLKLSSTSRCGRTNHALNDSDRVYPPLLSQAACYSPRRARGLQPPAVRGSVPCRHGQSDMRRRACDSHSRRCRHGVSTASITNSVECRRSCGPCRTVKQPHNQQWWHRSAYPRPTTGRSLRHPANSRQPTIRSTPPTTPLPPAQLPPVASYM